MEPRPPEAAVHVPLQPEVMGDDELGKTPADQVIGNPLLAEIIFGYTLCFKSNGYPEVSRKDLVNFRLVSECWKKAVSTFLEKKKEPLYVVQMTESNSLSGAPKVQKNGKILDNFVHFLNTREHLDSYAGFCLQMKYEVFRLENYDHLLNCLRECGQHLVEIQADVPMHGGSFPGQFPNTLQLASLKKLKLRLSNNVQVKNVTEAEMLPNPSANVFILIQQSLLQQSSILKHFHLVWFWLGWTWGWSLPEFQYLKLPSSLVTLQLRNSKNRRLLECLTRNSLSELKELTLCFSGNDQFPDENLIFQVFENLCHSLRVLRIIEIIDEGESCYVCNNIKIKTLR